MVAGMVKHGSRNQHHTEPVNQFAAQGVNGVLPQPFREGDGSGCGGQPVELIRVPVEKVCRCFYVSPDDVDIPFQTESFDFEAR